MQSMWVENQDAFRNVLQTREEVNAHEALIHLSALTP